MATANWGSVSSGMTLGAELHACDLVQSLTPVIFGKALVTVRIIDEGPQVDAGISDEDVHDEKDDVAGVSKKPYLDIY